MLIGEPIFLLLFIQFSRLSNKPVIKYVPEIMLLTNTTHSWYYQTVRLTKWDTHRQTKTYSFFHVYIKIAGVNDMSEEPSQQVVKVWETRTNFIIEINQFHDRNFCKRNYSGTWNNVKRLLQSFLSRECEFLWIGMNTKLYNNKKLSCKAIKNRFFCYRFTTTLKSFPYTLYIFPFPSRWGCCRDDWLICFHFASFHLHAIQRDIYGVLASFTQL